MLLVITRASCETFIRSDLKKNSTSKEGTYSCECHSGFVESFDDCIDIDECSLAINTCDRETSTCINTMGAFTCECLPGFERLEDLDKDGNKTCTEVDTCLTNLQECSANATCQRDGKHKVLIF